MHLVQFRQDIKAPTLSFLADSRSAKLTTTRCSASILAKQLNFSAIGKHKKKNGLSGPTHICAQVPRRETTYGVTSTLLERRDICMSSACCICDWKYPIHANFDCRAEAGGGGGCYYHPISERLIAWFPVISRRNPALGGAAANRLGEQGAKQRFLLANRYLLVQALEYDVRVGCDELKAEPAVYVALRMQRGKRACELSTDQAPAHPLAHNKLS
jgi:hypothetical protein